MLGRIFTVGGYTLLSRLTGFASSIMLAAILGAGPIADAFFVALRLPNSFRAIFAEGAFNTAFIPAYAHVHGKGGEVSARLFADRIFTLLFLSQVILLVVAWLFMPQVLDILAHHFPAERIRNGGSGHAGFHFDSWLVRDAEAARWSIRADVWRNDRRPVRGDVQLVLWRLPGCGVHRHYFGGPAGSRTMGGP